MDFLKDEFEELSRETDKPRKFKLRLLPSITDGEEILVGVELYITYTYTYPKDPPIYFIKAIKGLDDERMDEIKKLIDDQVTKIQSIFT